ncbi:MAG: glycohydrolase toxin TNT-related protein [Microbacterium sp.]|uniref:glycohydrolase toxin TNT-related protein n=1 Tax=Microbacterium sp. TaxID=51671 RepID=UPI001AD13BB2|nr:glycohydrolase toxin TNT-related protein [Microbacterium sp.]MBN9177615.1 glycohydrolase toxin TNT-related protein [Microbacterium sp.]
MALDTAAAVVDPLGSLIGAGLGWLMDHFDPLKGWLNDFAGDAGEVAGFAQTWSNIAVQMHGTGDELVRILGDVDELAGEAMDAYRRFQTDAAAHLHAAGQWAEAMGVGLQIASTIVQIIHDLVRDTIAQLVGSVISWAAEAVFTLGLATPVIVGQVTTRVASLSARVGKYVTKVIDAIRNLAKHLDSLKALFSKLSDLLEKTLKGARSAAHPHIETVAGLPGVRRLDPRRNQLIRDMQQWADDAAIPGYKPFGDLSGTEFIDTHLKQFSPTGYAEWHWPGANGFDTTRPIIPADVVLQPGDVIDRLSPVPPHLDPGEFTSPIGTAFPTQSLPPDRLSPAFGHHQLEIVKPLPPEVQAGWIAPDFQQSGGGVQYYFPGGINRWISDGYIKAT